MGVVGSRAKVDRRLKMCGLLGLVSDESWLLSSRRSDGCFWER